MEMYKAERIAEDIPLDHFDYHYVTKCNDVKELEKMLKVMRAGTLGAYPDLQSFIEQKLTSLAPKSKLLRKSEKLKNVKDLDYDQAKEILGDMENWTSQIKSAEGTLKTAPSDRADDKLPPVRGAAEQISVQTNKEVPKQDKKNKKPMPRSYRDWDRIDVDAELAKVDNEEVKVKENKNSLRKSKKPNISTTVDTTGLTDEEKEKVAEREKNKGNEAFRSGDYDEALMYYNRSISVVPSIPAINNRAQTYIKLKKWDEVIKDCYTVLQEDPDNVKALLRRVVGLQGKKEYKKAKVDLDHVLNLEPNNKRAQDLSVDIDGAIEEQKKKGRRMVIVDEEGSESEIESETEEKRDKEKVIEPKEQSISEALNINKKSEKILIEEMPDTETVTADCKSKDKGPSKEEIKKTSPKGTEGKPEPVKSESKPQKKATETDGLDTRIQKAKEEKIRMEEKIMQSKKQVQAAQADLAKKKAELESVQKSVDKSISEFAEASATSVNTTDNKAPEETPPAPLPPNLLKIKDEGKDLFTKGQYGEAAAKYSNVIDKLRKDPAQARNLAVIYSNRAACYFKTGDSKKCVEDCSSALEITPGALKALIRRAMAYEAMERYGLAYMDYSQVLYIDSSSIDLVMQGKNRCMKSLQELHGPKWREKLPSAQPITSGLTSSQPIRKQDTTDNAQTHKSSQSEQSSQKKDTKSPEEVEKEFEKLNNEGRKFVQCQDFQKAAEKYSQCIRICPHKSVGYTNRALCNIRLKQPQKVVEDCDAALKLEPENIKALFRRAQAFKILENYDSSKADLEKLLQLDPKNSSAKQELQQVNTHIENVKNTQPPKPEKEKTWKKVEILEVSDESDDETEEDEDEDDEETTSSASEKISDISEDRDQSSSTENIVHSVQEDEVEETSEAANVAEDSRTKEDVKSHEEAKPESEKSSKNNEAQSTRAEGFCSTENEDVKFPSSNKLTTPYEFIQAWTSLKRCTDPEPFAELVEQIEPQDLPKVISNKLDSNMLKMVIKCIEVFIDKGRLSQSLAYLQHLPSVPRFQVITMFMSNQEKSDLNYLLKKLEELGHCKYLTEDLRKLRKIYGLE